MALTIETRRRHGVYNAILVVLLSMAAFGLSSDLLDVLGISVDLSAEGLASLSEETENTLEELERLGVGVQIVGFDHQGRFRERDVQLADLLAVIDSSSANVRAEFISMDVNRSRALELGVERYGSMVIRGNGRRVDLEAGELFQADGAFIAEASIRRAISRLIAPTVPKVRVVVTGGGSFHLFEGLISDLGYDVERLALRDVGFAEGPADVLVLLANSGSVNAPLEALVREQLRDAGALLFAAEPGSSAWKAVEALGVSSPPGITYDERYVVPYPRQPHLEVIPHGINAGLVDSQSSPRVFEAGAVTVRPLAGYVWSELLRTSRKGWLESPANPNTQFNDGEDEPGPITVAAALNRHEQQSGLRSRAVVVADTEFFEDGFVGSGSGNERFIRNSMKWLLAQPTSGNRPPRAERPVVMSESELRSVQFAVLLPYPLLWILIGAFTLRLRRRE